MQSPARNPGGAGAGSRLTTGVPLVILTGLLAGLLYACCGLVTSRLGWYSRAAIYLGWHDGLRFGTLVGLVAAWRWRAAPGTGLALATGYWLHGCIRTHWDPRMWGAHQFAMTAALGVALAVAPLLAGWVVRRYLDPCPPAASPAPPPAPRLQRGGA